MLGESAELAPPLAHSGEVVPLPATRHAVRHIPGPQLAPHVTDEFPPGGLRPLGHTVILPCDETGHHKRFDITDTIRGIDRTGRSPSPSHASERSWPT